VLVTGASAGIGAGTAEHLAGLGCRLALVARGRPRLDQVRTACLSAGASTVVCLPCDLSQEEQCREAVAAAVRELGGIDILVNNAGVLLAPGIETISMADIDTSMDINLKAAVLLSQLCLPHLIASKGSIVNVSSIAGLRAYPGALAYKMSKAALDQFTRCLAMEVAGTGVRVNSVNPGVIRTEIFANSGMSGQEVEDYYELSRRLHPLGRPGTVLEVAHAIAFLASDSASFITGQTLAVDGGRSVVMPHAGMFQ